MTGNDLSARTGGTAVPRLTGRVLIGITGVYFLSRLLVLGAMSASRTVVLPGTFWLPTRSWIERLNLWDSTWYVQIARQGYTFDPHGQSSVAFYPLYPLLIRALMHCGLDPLVAGYAISHAALYAAAVWMWRLAALETRSATTANLAVTFLLLSPGAVWFGLIYTESLFLLTALGCLLAARRGRWLEAGVWGYAAAITRTPGLLLAGFLLLEAVQQRRESRRSGSSAPPSLWRQALAVAGPVLGQVTFLIFLQVAFGDWHAQQKTMTAGWFAGGPRWPWKALAQEWEWGEPVFSLLGNPALAVAMLAGFASAWTLRRWGYPALISALATLYLVSTNGDSLLRYVSTIAPVYVVLAQAARRSRLLETAVLSFSVAALVLVAVLLANGYRVI